jgi:hypothetical protein
LFTGRVSGKRACFSRREREGVVGGLARGKFVTYLTPVVPLPLGSFHPRELVVDASGNAVLHAALLLLPAPTALWRDKYAQNSYSAKKKRKSSIALRK